MIFITNKMCFLIYLILFVQRITWTLSSVCNTNFEMFNDDVKLSKYSQMTTALSRIACCDKCTKRTGCASVSFNANERICLLSDKETLEISPNSEWKTYIDTADDCLSEPCLNGALCTDALGTFICSCIMGWDGKQCDIDINECSGNPCLNSGMCVDHVGYYTCSCVTGYTGFNCETEIDYCSPNPCINGACYNILGVGTYGCTCDSGWDGDNCETEIDYCSPDPCINGACYNILGVGTYGCTCDSGWDGDNCDTDTIDQCAGSPCLNGAVCTDHSGYHSCACAGEYYGTNCEKSCEEGWNFFSGSCYLFVNSKTDWSTAKLNCEHTGAHLVDITSAGEQAFQQQLYLQYYPSTSVSNGIWNAAHSFVPSRVFTWSDESKLDDYEYHNWFPGQPDDMGGSEDCGIIAVWKDFTWNDTPCTREFLSICEKD